MSISNFFNKIKGHHTIDNITIMYFIIIIIVGICSFFIGRWSYSVENDHNNYINEVYNKGKEIEGQESAYNVNEDFDQDIIVKKNYVASKNGKMYYSAGCSGAKRIKPENQIWFNTAEEALKSGYVLSKTCK